MSLSRGAMILLLSGCAGGPEAPGVPACPELLACPPPVEVVCTAPMTPASVPDAATCPVAEVSDDRAESYPLGVTPVSFQASAGLLDLSTRATCSTSVTVIDQDAPIVVCEPSVTLARSSPLEAYPDPPVGEARDRCDPDSVTITVSPARLTEPLTDVRTTAVDGSGNEASCVTPTEVLDLFAVDGLRLLAAERTGDGGTRAFLGWEAPPSTDVTGLEIQRAESPDGPWDTVQTMDADAHTLAVEQEQAGWWRVRSTGGGLIGGASEPLQVHAIATDAYNLSGQSVPTVPFSTSLYGVVRHPADLSDGPHPLVVLLHGNHGNCRRVGTRDDFCGPLTGHECPYDGFFAAPNAEGMVFQAETLAAQGAIAVTLSANALNCRGNYIQQRAQLIVEHIRRWKAWTEGSRGPTDGRYAGAVDLSRIGLVGHSRGGDAVSTVPAVLEATPVAGVDVVSVFAIAPTDFDDVTVFDTSWAVLLPACDGDVSNLWGSDIYERSRADVPHKAQVFMPGANHNYFSTEWDFDDGRRACAGRALVGRPAQLAMLESTLSSWMARTLLGQRPEAFHRAESGTPDPVSEYLPRPLDLRWSYIGQDALLIDDFGGELARNEVGGSTTLTGFETTSPCFGSDCGPAFLADTQAVRLGWTADAGPAATCTLAGTDTSPFDAVSFRVVSRDRPFNDGRSDQPVRLVVTDGSGQRASVDITGRVPHLYDGFNRREVLQTVRVPFSELEAANVDLDTSDLDSVSIELDDATGPGSVAITDVALGY